MSTLALKHKTVRQIDLQIRQARTVLRQLQETLEDLEDRRALAKAKKRNAGKPGTPWSEVAKELGISRKP
jgi:hypothetical protein